MHYLSNSPWIPFVPSLTEGKQLPILQHIQEQRQQGHTIFPPDKHIFQALICTKPQDVRVVILGQDPYHGQGQSHGLAFSVPDNMPCPPSLKNIFKEIQSDVYNNTSLPNTSTNLTRWAQQGVLLLNTILTVSEGKPLSHAQLGWQEITRDILTTLIHSLHPIAFLLWGKAAQTAMPPCPPATQHLILQAAHPSPLSATRGFYGCKHFSHVNAWLVQQGHKPIVW